MYIVGADVEGELLGSAPSLDAWNWGGVRQQQAAGGAIDLPTSSSSGLGELPPVLCMWVAVVGLL